MVNEKMTNEEIATLVANKVYYPSKTEADFVVQLLVERLLIPDDIPLTNVR